MSAINSGHNILQALITCSQVFLKEQDVKPALQAVYTSCKSITGAAAGYVTLGATAQFGSEFFYPEMAEMETDLDPTTLIRAVQEKRQNSEKVLLVNNFQQSHWLHDLSGVHDRFANILLAPVVLDNNYAGIFCFADKPGGFCEDDASVAGFFAELAAVGLHQKRRLHNSKTNNGGAHGLAGLQSQSGSGRSEKTKQLGDQSRQGMKQIVHELGTYQIGLEMQNEKLRFVLQDLEVSRRRYSDLYEFAPVGYFTLDPDGIIILVNLVGAAMLGRTRKQLQQRPFMDFVHEEDRDLFRQCTRETLQHVKKHSCELRLNTQEGMLVYFHLESVPVRDDAGTVCEVRMTATDISPRKQMEKTLQESESLFRTIFETSPSAINMNRLQDGKFIMVNNSFLELAGYTKEEVIGKTALEINIWVDLDKRAQFFSKLLQEGKVTNFAADFRHKDGKILNTQVSAGTFSYQGEPHLLAVTLDITDLKKAEQALRETHRQLKTKFEERSAELKDSRIRYYEVVEALLTGVYMHTGKKIVFVNKEFADIFGYSKNELLHMNLYELIHPDDREFFKELQENLPVTENASTDFEMRGLHKNGDILYLLGRSKPVVDLQDQQVILGNIADISKRRLAEEERLKTEEELRILSAQLMSAEERERKRIASDIHDSIGQALSAIKFSIENALNTIPSESFPLAVEALQNIIPLTQEAIEEVRRIIMDLRPSILDDLGLIATISWFCREFETIFAGIRIEKEIRVEENDIAPALKTVIYRILQEALNNAAKHSRTNLIRLQLKKYGDNLEMQIEDRGQGFNIKEAQSRDKDEKGMGLTSMKERAQLSGGVFNIQASPGKGTIILISWPLEAGGYKHVRETAG